MIAFLLLLVGCADTCDEPGAICTVAGIGAPTFGAPTDDARDTPLYWPADVVVAPDGDTWVVDWNNHRILALSPTERFWSARTITGGGLTGDGPFDVPLVQARWNHPTGITFSPDGLPVMAGWHNSRVVALDTDLDRAVLLGGNGERAFSGDDGAAVDAALDLPSSTAFGDDGRLYVSDQANQRIRCIEPSGDIVTVVGNGERAYAGDGGPALDASLRSEVSQNADPGGRIAIHDHRMYIADTLNNAIRVVDMDTWIIDTYVGHPDIAEVYDTLALSSPRDVAIGPDGSLYIADTRNHCIRRVVGDSLETVAGRCDQAGRDGDGGPATEALLDSPLGIDVDDDGTLWIADTWNHVVRKVTPVE